MNGAGDFPLPHFFMAEIFGITGDKLVIPGIRESATQPFSAPNWLDLRVGMYLSLCPSGVGQENSPPTGLTEAIAVGVWNPNQYLWIGLKDSGLSLPSASPGQFIGWTNARVTFNPSNSNLVSSDIALGNDSTLWRCTNGEDVGSKFMFIDNGFQHGYLDQVLTPHFVQNTATRGYTGMIGFQLTRPAVNSNVVTVHVPHSSSFSCDINFTNAPTLAQLLSLLDPWPTTVLTLGPYSFSNIPSSLFMYWPFHNSRLRCSVWGILQAA